MSEFNCTEAHKHSSNHREEVLLSDWCACFYCCEVYSPTLIAEWVDEVDGIGKTALCPKCGIDSVIGSKSGYPNSPEFLQAMHQQWFGD